MTALEELSKRIDEVAKGDVLLKKSQVLKILGVSQSTLDNRMTRLRRVKLTGGRNAAVRFTKQDILEFVKGCME